MGPTVAATADSPEDIADITGYHRGRVGKPTPALPKRQRNQKSAPGTPGPSGVQAQGGLPADVVHAIAMAVLAGLKDMLPTPQATGTASTIPEGQAVDPTVQQPSPHMATADTHEPPADSTSGQPAATDGLHGSPSRTRGPDPSDATLCPSPRSPVTTPAADTRTEEAELQYPTT